MRRSEKNKKDFQASKETVTQMVSAILKDEAEKLSPERKKELSKQLSSRAMEYFMFLDD